MDGLVRLKRTTGYGGENESDDNRYSVSDRVGYLHIIRQPYKFYQIANSGKSNIDVDYSESNDPNEPRVGSIAPSSFPHSTDSTTKSMSDYIASDRFVELSPERRNFSEFFANLRMNLYDCVLRISKKCAQFQNDLIGSSKSMEGKINDFIRSSSDNLDKIIAILFHSTKTLLIHHQNSNLECLSSWLETIRCVDKLKADAFCSGNNNDLSTPLIKDFINFSRMKCKETLLEVVSMVFQSTLTEVSISIASKIQHYPRYCSVCWRCYSRNYKPTLREVFPRY